MTSRVQKKRTRENIRVHVATPNVVDAATQPAAAKKKIKPYTKPHTAEKRQFNPNKIVEIYHNNAAKESDSDGEEKNKQKTVKSKPQHTPDSAVPHLPLGHEYGDCKETCGEQMEYYEEPQAPRAYANKNYELPTIASKMKQAAKLGFNMFNFKAIPFCPVSSTTPSHNIGINIQQVMSIIKTRQPVQGISPTLAHNINLAAEKLSHDPLNSFVSSMTSRTGYGRCPLGKQHLNYRQLEELAKQIPDDAVDEIEEPLEENNRSVIITGPSGDMEIKAPNTNGWTNENRRACTCTPQGGVDFGRVYHKYRSHGGSEQKHVHAIAANTVVKKNSETTPRRRQIKNEGCFDANYFDFRRDDCRDDFISPLRGKEKNLKEVLINLHDDFEAMNRRYEFLTTQLANGESDDDVSQEIEELEAQLSKKEEEITIVMTLYREVLALKQQIKSLKSRSCYFNEHRERPRECTSKTTQHITKLLQQIQQYHTHYKSRSFVGR